jgi:hypothetical protein
MMEKTSNLQKDIQSQNTMQFFLEKMTSNFFSQISNIKIIEL